MMYRVFCSFAAWRRPTAPHMTHSARWPPRLSLLMDLGGLVASLGALWCASLGGLGRIEWGDVRPSACRRNLSLPQGSVLYIYIYISTFGCRRNLSLLSGQEAL